MDKNKTILTLIFIFLVDLFILKNLFFPTNKIFATPEFFGGDFFTFEIPLQKINCEYIKKNRIPFWSKNISFGYPIFAEGQIGFFNPINFITCKLLEYPNAFKWQIITHLYFGQLGAFFLARSLNFTFFSSVFFAFLFFFSPFLLMNWMHASMIYPFSFLPWLLFFLILFLNKKKLIFYLLFITFIFFQFISAHHQSFFISCLFIFCFYFFYFKKTKGFLTNFFWLIFAYLAAILLAGFQTLPLIEFIRISNRISNFSSAALYDQNLTLQNLLTLFSPNFFGSPTDGSYRFFEGPDPWEGTIFIYYTGLFFLIVSFFRYKDKLVKTFAWLMIIFFLLALGKNSPIYLIHYLPVFSSFRFPTRYLFIFVFLISFLSAYGFEIFFRRFRFNFLKFLALSILLMEIVLFFNQFHVLMSETNLYKPPPVLFWLKEDRYLVSTLTSQYLDQIYTKYGHKKEDFYYDFANNFMLGNIGSVYNKQSFNNKFGPQLKRYIYYYGLIEENFDKKEKNITFDKKSVNLINLAGINYILSVYPVKNDNFKLLNKKKFNNYQIFVYKNQTSLGRMQFFNHYYLAETFDDFKKLISEGKSNFAIVEKDKNWPLDKNNKIDAEYKILVNNDDLLKIKIKTNNNTLLVLADTYYPGWQAYLNNKEVEIERVNLLFRGIYLPKGSHEVIFKYYPDSFKFGLKITIIAVLGLSLFFILIKKGWD